MAYVQNNNLHRISIERAEGGTPLRVNAGGVIEADGELLDKLVATRGVETVGKKEYEAAQQTRAEDVDVDEIREKQESGEAYKAPDVIAQEEHDAAHGAPITTEAAPSKKGA